MSESNFRDFVPLAGKSKIAGGTARDHANAVTKNKIIMDIFSEWKNLLAQPFKGITNDGLVKEGLFFLRRESAPTDVATKVARNLLDHLSATEREKTCFDVNSQKWRDWQNTEIYVEVHGLRLESLKPFLRDLVLQLIKVSLSEKGFRKTRDVMKLNQFLGDIVGGVSVLGEWSYLFCLFGTPSLTSPWGWQLFGHHLALNCLFIEEQVVLSPTFMGAEPNYADEGRFMGIRVFQDEERQGLEFMQALSKDQQKQALVASSMVGGDLHEGRRKLADGLHLGGAYQDNRIIPYEGLRGNLLTRLQRNQLLELVQEYLCTLPTGPLNARMADIERHLDETHFCWIGSRDENKPFYYRIQSPINLIEFDHHSGVYLTNEEPANFHVHTLVRTPNGNDYGIDLIRQHYAQIKHS